MRVTFSATNVDELYAELSQQPGASLCSDSFETTLKLPPQIGNGWLRQIKLRPGLEITLKHFQVSEPFIAEISSDFNWNFIELTTSLSGQIRSVIEGMSDECYITPKQSRVSFFNNCAGWIECQPFYPVLHVEVTAELPVLNELIAGQSEQLPLDVRNTLAEKSNNPFSYFQPTPRPVFKTTEQILNCPYQGLTRRLYLESRALELIALQLPVVNSEAVSSKPKHYILKADDVDRIYYAKEILLNDLERPPSLMELAQQVGLNDYKLKQGFRQIFGTTAFGCLYHYRMERAKTLLETHHSTVTEVAQAVGYASTTSFSAAFKKKFGMSPRNYKLRP